MLVLCYLKSKLSRTRSLWRVKSEVAHLKAACGWRCFEQPDSHRTDTDSLIQDVHELQNNTFSHWQLQNILVARSWPVSFVLSFVLMHVDLGSHRSTVLEVSLHEMSRRCYDTVQ